MRLKIIIFALMIAICGAADALTFDQRVYVEGNGNLSARTTTDAAKDAVVGCGEQEYARNLNLGEGATNLISNYYLNSTLDERKNRYYVEMNNGLLEHYMDIYSSSYIESVCSIDQSAYGFETDYSVDVKMGKLSEGILEWDNYDDSKTETKIAETEVEGNFVLQSNLSDEVKRTERIIGWDPNLLMEMMDSVANASATPPPSEEPISELVDQEWELPKGLPLGIYSQNYIRQSGGVSERSVIFLGGYKKQWYGQ